MTRADIERSYHTCDGRILDPGKFEGEMLYVPYFWEIYLNGFADDDGRVLSFKVEPEDKQLFPELKNRRVVKLVESENGFVMEI